MNSQTKQNVFVDRNRQRIGTLENHTNRFSEFLQGNIWIVNVFTKYADQPCGGDITIAFVHPIKATEQSSLAAARGANEPSNQPIHNLDADIYQRLEIAIPQVQFVGFDAVVVFLISQRFHSRSRRSFCLPGSPRK